MPKRKIGKGSKRLACSRRYKIEKKVRQHNKKLKKQQDNSKRRKGKKDPGVPNKCPFKNEILDEAVKIKTAREEERKKKMEKRKKERSKLVDQKRNLNGLVADAASRTENFERQNKFVEEKSKLYTGGKAIETSLKAFYREVKKVIEDSDVIIEVLDARDPIGSRCSHVEETVLSSGPNKKLILLLNKIDLVPKENVESWLKYLRNEFPTVAFKASTQSQADRLSHSKVPVSLASDELLKSSHCLGADVLMNLLSNYCRSRDIKTSITIGIVGFPNTGKSSVINSLKRSKACSIGATPGVTKTIQTVQLDKHIKLLDSPGVVMTTDMNDDAIILHNCVKLESIEDPIKPVSVILSRINKKQMMMNYGLGDFQDVTEFLTLLAQKNGKLKKGGIADIEKAARIVLQDWNNGKIKFFTHPPVIYAPSSYVTAEIVSVMREAFDIESLLKDEKSALEVLMPTTSSDVVIMSDMTSTVEMMENEVDEDANEASSDVDVSRNKIQSKTENKILQLPGNQQLNKERKNAFKKAKKQRKREDTLASDLNKRMALSAGSSDEEYDFHTDYA